MLCSIPLLSQTAQVSGAVRDGMNESIPFASVFLLQVSDSSVVKGASADENGLFVIENVLPDLYFIRASYIGKTSDLIAIDISGEVKIGALIIDQAVEFLDEVVVNSVKPLIERKADRLIFNVENSVASQGSSWEVLKRTPGVIAVQDNLQVRNQSVTVYINDRKVQLSSLEVRSLLENLSGAQIKLIEVINNPPAKYDAEGGPVLNIVMAKNIALGYKGNVSSTFTQAIFPKYTFGTAQFYKTSKFNVFASYTYGPSKEFKNVDSNINFIDDSGIFSRWGTDFDKTSRAKTHNGLLNLDYAFDDRNELRLASNMLLSPDKSFDQTQVTEMRNRLNVLDSTFITGSQLLEDKNNLSADLTYIHRFKEEGNLSLNGQYTKFNYDLTQDAVSDYFDPQDRFIRAFAFFTDANQEVDIYTAQLDISSKMGSVSYETGLKDPSSIRGAAWDSIMFWARGGCSMRPCPTITATKRRCMRAISALPRNGKNSASKRASGQNRPSARGRRYRFPASTTCVTSNCSLPCTCCIPSMKTIASLSTIPENWGGPGTRTSIRSGCTSTKTILWRAIPT